MRKLETYVNEKLKVTKPKTITKTIPAPDLTDNDDLVDQINYLIQKA